MARAVLGRNAMSSNTAQSGIPQGTPGGISGGRPASAGRRPGMQLAVGEEVYIWLVVLVEVFIMGLLRKRFRRFHGG